MASRALTKSPNLATQQLAYPAIAVGADDRESLSVTDHDMPTHSKPFQDDESNIVLEFQSRVMSTFISDPAAWLRRERRYLKMDNSTTQPRGIKLDSNASHRTAPPESVTESQVSSEDLTPENIDEN
ncbi:SWIRM domain-containing protein [Fusarium coicis]|nr:SWIRM domain-containing protein [Fusarium coicis]